MFRLVSHAGFLQAYGHTLVARGGWNAEATPVRLIFVPLFCHASAGSTHSTDNTRSLS